MANAKKQVGTVLGLGLIMAAIRTALITYNMEKNSSESDTYYLPENFAVTAFAVASVLFILFGVFMALKLGLGKKVDLDRKSVGVSAASLVLAFVLIGASIIYIFSADEALSQTLPNVVFVTSLLSVAAFLVLGLPANVGDGKKPMLAVLTLAPLFLSVARLLCDFISTSATPLASSGAYHITGLAAVLLYFLCEGKSYVSDGSAALYFIFGNVSTFLLLVYAVPNLIMHCFGVFCFDYYAAFSAVDIALAIYVCVRMSTAKILPKGEPDEVDIKQDEIVTDR